MSRRLTSLADRGRAAAVRSLHGDVVDVRLGLAPLLGGDVHLREQEVGLAVVGREAEPGSEVVQDIGSLADHEIAGFEKRRRELRMRDFGSS